MCARKGVYRPLLLWEDTFVNINFHATSLATYSRHHFWVEDICRQFLTQTNNRDKASRSSKPEGDGEEEEKEAKEVRGMACKSATAA